jgi:hypothetical protein
MSEPLQLAFLTIARMMYIAAKKDGRADLEQLERLAARLLQWNDIPQAKLGTMNSGDKRTSPKEAIECILGSGADSCIAAWGIARALAAAELPDSDDGSQCRLLGHLVKKLQISITDIEAATKRAHLSRELDLG